jgi:hypothetical protein
MAEAVQYEEAGKVAFGHNTKRPDTDRYSSKVWWYDATPPFHYDLGNEPSVKKEAFQAVDERGLRLRERVLSTFCSTEVHMKIVISEGAARLISDGCCIARTERKRETYYRSTLRPTPRTSSIDSDRRPKISRVPTTHSTRRGTRVPRFLKMGLDGSGIDVRDPWRDLRGVRVRHRARGRPRGDRALPV